MTYIPSVCIMHRFEFINSQIPIIQLIFESSPTVVDPRSNEPAYFTTDPFLRQQLLAVPAAWFTAS